MAAAAAEKIGSPSLLLSKSLEDGFALEPEVLVYDFFSGCGGTSAGLRRAGMTPVLAIDFDREAAQTYQLNFPRATFICEDVRALLTSDLERFFDRPRRTPTLLSACAPCQPFSRQNRQKRESDRRATLLSEIHRFVRRFRPELLVIENVPGLGASNSNGESPFSDLVEFIEALGYFHQSKILRAQDFGVPQSRERLILVASQFGPVSFPSPTHGAGDRPFLTVRDAIAHFPPISAGETEESIPNHRSSALSQKNLERIRATAPESGRLTWSEELKLRCHIGLHGFTDVYGRMSWDRPAPAMTTRCISLSNGRFGHPDQDRAISIREAAALQTFEDDFVFVGSINGMARQIGNAVPVQLAHAVGSCLIEHVRSHVGTDRG
jgi:DNA (cytosine-5)-methyltransferase 1